MYQNIHENIEVDKIKAHVNCDLHMIMCALRVPQSGLVEGKPLSLP